MTDTDAPDRSTNRRTGGAAAGGVGAAGAGRAAAVVLAGGLSSRMGSAKPLLPLGSGTALERVVGSLREAGAGHIVVVTGHEAEKVAPVIEQLGVARAHNPAYESGMFSSVRTGVAALPLDVDAFFVLPVDCPLVTPRVLHLLLDRLAVGDASVVYPTCLERRGHPPLLAGHDIGPLLGADPGGNLQAFLESLGAQAEVEVRDLTVLMDMDTPDDHQALVRFAEALDNARSSLPEPSLTEEDAVFLLTAAGTPQNVVRHCRTAAAVGAAVAEALKSRMPQLDVDLVRAGCLLHDMARLLPHHATLAAEVLTNLGLPRLAHVVGEHMVIDADLPRSPGITEAELVYLADKTVTEGEIVGLEERQARTIRKMRPSPATAERIASRIQDARLISAKAAGVLGRPVEEILQRVELPAEARSETMRVYLVRHAQTEASEDRRYRGQEDQPLGPRGVEQARELGSVLMGLTGGACFDAVISSDLSRSWQTAKLVAEECGTPVLTEPCLREIDAGLWEGLTRTEARERFPAEYAAREADVFGTRFPGGESFTDLRDRAVPAFERLVERSLADGHRRILVVGHKGVNRVLLAHYRGIPLADIFSIEQGFGAVTTLKATTGNAGGCRVTAVEVR